MSLLVLLSGPTGTTVTPTTASLTTTTFAPTVSVESAIVWGAWSATFSNPAAAPVMVTPSTAALTLSAFAPTVTASDHKTVTPTTAALILTALTPTVTASAHQSVTPTTAALTLGMLAPSVSATGGVTPPIGTGMGRIPFRLNQRLIAPVTVRPSTARLRTRTFAPSVEVRVIPNFELEELILIGAV